MGSIYVLTTFTRFVCPFVSATFWPLAAVTLSLDAGSLTSSTRRCLCIIPWPAWSPWPGRFTMAFQWSCGPSSRHPTIGLTAWSTTWLWVPENCCTNPTVYNLSKANDARWSSLFLSKFLLPFSGCSVHRRDLSISLEYKRVPGGEAASSQADVWQRPPTSDLVSLYREVQHTEHCRVLREHRGKFEHQ